MKLTTILLLSTFLQVSARTYAQSVTIVEKNLPLEKAFSMIEKQTGFTFYYKVELLRNAKRVDLNIKNLSLEKTLELLFRDQPLSFAIIEKNIVLKAKEASSIAKTEEPEAPVKIDVRGVVMSDNGVIPNASVIVKRTGRGVSANARGEFFLIGLEENDVLIFSATGYQQREVPLEGRTTLAVVLKTADNRLDEIIVRPYGQLTNRRLNTGSISKVSSEEIQRQPVTNLLSALAGRVAGLTISQSSGVSGADVFFNIRGRNSLSANDYTAAPLVIVDGVPYPNIPINNPAQNGGPVSDIEANENLGYGSPLYMLNPNDIESVEVLKDADATAIYGSRAANGVLLITTKKGRQGKTNVTVTANSGFAVNNRRTEMLNTQEYMQLRREAFRNANSTPTAANAPDLFLWDSTKNTDWQEKLTGFTARTNDLSFSISGGQGGTSFLISGSYHDESGIYIDRRKSSKGGFHFSINNSSANGKLMIGLSGMVNYTKTVVPTTNFGSAGFRMPPHWEPFDEQGNLKWDFGGFSPYNPYAGLLQTYSNNGLSFTSNLDVKYSILPGLDAKISFGYSRSESDERYLRPRISLDPGVVASRAGEHKMTRSLQQSINFEPQILYSKYFSNSKLDVVAGATVMKSVYEMPFYVDASNFNSDAFIDNWQLANTIFTNFGYNSYQYASLFSRATYNYKDKYLVNGSFRRDGSSRFGPNNRFGNFGAIGAAWVFSEEKAVKNMGVLSFGKLRGSYGVVGSDNVANYAYFGTYQSYLYRYNGSVGLIPSRLVNPDFQWEKSDKLEAALELGFLKDRLLVSASTYRNRTGNQLVNYPTSGQTGFSGYVANLDAAVVQNNGWEFDLNTVNVKSKNFTWNTSFNLSLQRNKLLEFENIENTTYVNQFVVGKPLTSYFGLRFTGINEAGVPQYEDANKDGVIDYTGNGLEAYGKGDRVFIGKSNPDYYGGLTNSLNYKGLQLDFTFQFVKGLLKPNYLRSISTPGNVTNVPKKAVEDLRDLGIDKAMIRPGFGLQWLYYTLFSDAIYTDASFIRLTNVALSYRLNESIVKKMKLTSVRFFVNSQNLFVISNFDGFDPESGAVAIPPLLRLVGGIQVSF
ncbi:SusC/RagA family TonB-linked outer membrane protein [Flavihumibacter sp. RY-1]|uniref:SusC/RagA family TonB-linked outer membrane protein n=1 Tax=Flavihumibacter fluminis TaxID=2909236 RepID=A0ABS9BMF7_9BACT|nr:SusC/RagA family TonB-linked outer membrane protein [Flavihumibacter fluminis]MCF1716355.1 SusC/RagA family TonB-linked outer membrane protein [Flavihumibacter fluminis]